MSQKYKTSGLRLLGDSNINTEALKGRAKLEAEKNVISKNESCKRFTWGAALVPPRTS